MNTIGEAKYFVCGTKWPSKILADKLQTENESNSNRYYKRSYEENA